MKLTQTQLRGTYRELDPIEEDRSFLIFCEFAFRNGLSLRQTYFSIYVVLISGFIGVKN
jgi:hypothetical protein